MSVALFLDEIVRIIRTYLVLGKSGDEMGVVVEGVGFRGLDDGEDPRDEGRGSRGFGCDCAGIAGLRREKKGNHGFCDVFWRCR